MLAHSLHNGLFSDAPAGAQRGPVTDYLRIWDVNENAKYGFFYSSPRV